VRGKKVRRMEASLLLERRARRCRGALRPEGYGGMAACRDDRGLQNQPKPIGRSPQDTAHLSAGSAQNNPTHDSPLGF